MQTTQGARSIQRRPSCTAGDHTSEHSHANGTTLSAAADALGAAVNAPNAAADAPNPDLQETFSKHLQPDMEQRGYHGIHVLRDAQNPAAHSMSVFVRKELFEIVHINELRCNSSNWWILVDFGS